MLKTWTVLLLCILLPSQQAIEQVASSSVAMVDKAVLEKTISESLASGGLLQGLLGGGNLLGEILGGGQGGSQGGGLLGGILGGQKGGLLGSVEGLLGGKESLLGLKIVDIVLPEIKLKFLPGVGLGLNIYTKVELKGDTLLGGVLNLLVKLNITGTARIVQDKSGGPKFLVDNCKTNIAEIKLLSGPGLLNLGDLLTNLLNNLLPGVLCPVIDLVVNILNTVLNTVNGILPMGTLGKLHYTLAGLPLFQGQQLVLNLNTLLTDNEGNTVNLAPSELTSLPPVADHASQLVISSNVVSSLIKMLVAKGELDGVLSNKVLSGLVPMTTSALQSVLPQVSRLLPKDEPLEVKIKVRDVPVVSLQNGKASVTLKATIEVLARTSSGLTPLFDVDADIHFVGKVAITGKKLGITLSFERVSLRLASSEIGSFDIELLENWLKTLLQVGYTPVVNAGLNIGLPLPNILDMGYASGVVDTAENAIVAPLTP